MEFAIVAPILFALVFGIFDFGRCMSANVTVTNSAREGARYAATLATSWTAPAAPWPAASQSRFGFQCPTGTTPTAPESDGPPGAAWRQLQAANLDLTQVTITVSYYNSDPNTNPAIDVQSCPNAYGNASYGTASESNPGYTPQSGDWVRVEVSYKYAPVTPVISNIVHNPITIDQTATMVLE